MVYNPTPLCITFLNTLLYMIWLEKVVFSHWDFNLDMAGASSPVYSSINI